MKLFSVILAALVAVIAGCAAEAQDAGPDPAAQSQDPVVGIVRHYYLHGKDPATVVDEEIRISATLAKGADKDGIAKQVQAIYTSNCASNGLVLYHDANYYYQNGKYICVHGVGSLAFDNTVRYPGYENCYYMGAWEEVCKADHLVLYNIRSLVNNNANDGAHRCTFFNNSNYSWQYYNAWDPYYRIYYSASTPGGNQYATRVDCDTYLN